MNQGIQAHFDRPKIHISGQFSGHRKPSFWSKKIEFSTKIYFFYVFQNKNPIIKTSFLDKILVNIHKNQRINKMPVVLKKGKEHIRICPNNTLKLNTSLMVEKLWILRYMGNPAGPVVLTLERWRKETLAATWYGSFYSKNKGNPWLKRG